MGNTQYVVSNQCVPYLNLAVEQYLVESAQVPTLYLWRNRRTVVIGQNQNPFTEVNMEALKADGGYLMRRRTGGGAVYHDDGNLNFSFVIPKELYDQRRQFAVVQKAVESFGLRTELSGRNDIMVMTPEQGSGKFSGNAFSKGRKNDLHHGTLLINGNISDLALYLKPKPAKLLKHGVSSVRSRVVNLHDLCPEISTESIAPRLRAAFEAEYGSAPVCLDFDTLAALPRVKDIADELSSDRWLYGFWQSFKAERSGQFEWGGVEVQLIVEDGIIRDVRIASDALDVAALESTRTLLVGKEIKKRPPLSGSVVVDDIVSLVF